VAIDFTLALPSLIFRNTRQTMIPKPLDDEEETSAGAG
jgi:hypothetical protein